MANYAASGSKLYTRNFTDSPESTTRQLFQSLWLDDMVLRKRPFLQKIRT